MNIAKPTGGYAEQMLEPGGWPELNEGALYDRADEYTEVLRRVTEILESCQHQQSEIFDGGAWSGGAANAANGELDTDIGELVTLQNGLATVITWERYAALSVVQAKSDITDNVELAHQQITVLERDSTLDAAERTTAINTVVMATYGANISVMEGAAERILASKAWKPPGNALKDLLDQKTPPPLTLPDSAVPVPPVEGDRPPQERPEDDPRPVPTEPPPVTPPPTMPVNPAQPPPVSPMPGLPPTPTPGAPPPAGQPLTPPPGMPGPAVPGTPGAGPGMPPGPGAGLGPGAPLGPAAPAVPLSPAAASPSPGGTGKGMAPASAKSPSLGSRSDETSTAAAPAGAAGMPAAPMGGGASAGSSGSGGRSAAPVGQKPSSTPPSTRPAATARSTMRPAPAAQSKSTDPDDSAEEVPVPPPVIPVSAARAERDAVAEAATPEAARRQGGGTDPLTLARRIAAALNAPGSGGEGDLGFFWVTALTTGGAIVVANSYGLAYIPDAVQLPDQVHMASADEAIPPAERARWATYPVLAVQGWAEHHETKLRAVIATEQQFANSDPGTAKIVLKPDDIPATGVMQGRSRLQVVDPSAAERLAATDDARLSDLLPPAPVAAGQAEQRPTSEATDSDAAVQLATAVSTGTVDPQQLLTALPAEAGPATDDRAMLWFSVVKPLASKAAGRSAAHLRAFHTYASHAREVVLREAHTEADLAAQRSAVADWLYWKHLSALLDAALNGAA
jgi:hypothetical protein